MNYAQWVQAVAGYLPAQLAGGPINTETPFVTNSRYNLVVDRAIEYAELRMYRDPDLDFLATRTLQDGSSKGTLTAGSRVLGIPNSMVVVEEINVITPAGHPILGANSIRNPCEAVSVAFINQAYGQTNFQAQPVKWARPDDTDVIFGPTPDQGYIVEFYGTVRPAPLSYSNTTTVLTLNFPDLFLAASMIWWSMYQKNVGAVQSLGPMDGVSWEQQYTTLKSGASVEEFRKKAQSAAWTPMVPTPIATPPRA
jgi:hypothetical protein